MAMHKLEKILNALVEINRADLVHSIFVAFKIVLCSLLLVLKLHIFIYQIIALLL